MTDEYPEHEKLKAVADKSQAIHDFLEWLGDERRIVLGHRVRWDGWDHDDFVPYQGGHRDLLAEFFDIDMNKIEDEKRAILDRLREASA